MCLSNFSPNTLGKFCIPLGILGFFGSCSEDPEIQSYSITPEYDGPVIVWKLPDHWGENPELSGPLAGSFHVKTDSGPKGRIGVMPFREAVSSLEITNMFGMELGYQGFNQETLKQVLQVKKIEGKNFDWIRLTERVQSENPSTALLAILRNEQDTWLFPFIADAQLINAEMESFTNFLGSIIARAGKKKIRAVMPALPPPPVPTASGNPTWETPKHWLPGKVSSMRVGSFLVQDENGKELDFSITTFPGDVGGLLPNINRWLGQVNLPEVNPDSQSKYVSEIILDEKSAQLLIAENEEKSVYGALYFGPSQSWFFKLIGDSELARVEKENFLTLLESVCFHDH